MIRSNCDALDYTVDYYPTRLDSPAAIHAYFEQLYDSRGEKSLIKTEFSTLLFMALMAVVFLSHQSPSNFTSSKILLAQFIFP